MFQHLDDANPPQPGPHERARVFSRVDELVHHRRMLMGLGVAVVVALVAAVPGVLTAAGGGAKRVHTAASPATTPTTSEETSGVVNPVTGEPVPGGSSATPTTTPQVLGNSFIRPQPTTRTNPAQGTTAPQPGRTSPTQPGGQSTFTSPTTACRNSSDPACGPFFWDPDPGPNEPFTGQMTFAPANPKAGDAVTFHLTGTDPDADPVHTCNVSFGDGPDIVCDPAPAVNACPRQYGGWAPPPRKQGTLDESAQYTYAHPGTYKVSFDIRSAAEQCNNPYASSATLTTTVVVS